ncbi:bifunctional (p)ppGpp synthetase/guanosine-3',5'-bis(diphosphate) 3'-pyrophosphohydrolase [Neobacillus notoginsengisoli]|uniref:Bifunctional (P)ppGpp synthetase/guanosine-3',5'-bis(Diphosphate) 3'-pyrophosphohydrolase n=1 Tax=Neobacillus notoginsengisoli TaxID=1578198 RepID=A0A417YS47_9BACI|nr:HD domain-containing protein [Neobacillus notoginsengisoli]RHW38127.1 bifunctional (p)ppGpp synthetase/guanosine-3',5'-bis(diphosphate) 3'-pyrophosphohydrolase [Neobacillus notoginsengisoli]
MDLIEKALRIAGEAHDGQFRKLTKMPYITHPAAVGMILQKYGYGEELIAAGILHDTVEDTNLSLNDIEREFGPMIAKIVAGCSEPDKSLSWEERKAHTIEFLKDAPIEIRAVACADKLHNIRSIRYDVEQSGEEVWKRFKRGRKEQEWYYRRLVQSLGHESSFEMLEEFGREVVKLFGEELQ